MTITITNNNNNENQPEIPNFEDFIHLNEKSNKEKFFKGRLLFTLNLNITLHF